MSQSQVFIELRIGGNVRTGVQIRGKEVWDVARRIRQRSESTIYDGEQY
jgi:hypothetical protein